MRQSANLLFIIKKSLSIPYLEVWWKISVKRICQNRINQSTLNIPESGNDIETFS